VLGHERAQLEADSQPLAVCGTAPCVALVSGPRRVRKVLPRCRVTTISKWLAATDKNVPARSLWQRQTRSTNCESDGLSSKIMNMLCLPVWDLAIHGIGKQRARRNALVPRWPRTHRWSFVIPGQAPFPEPIGHEPQDRAEKVPTDGPDACVLERDELPLSVAPDRDERLNRIARGGRRRVPA
jgi:hypothetical protein